MNLCAKCNRYERRAPSASYCRFCHSEYVWRQRCYAKKREKNIANTRDSMRKCTPDKTSGIGAINTASALTKTLKGTQSNG